MGRREARCRTCRPGTQLLQLCTNAHYEPAKWDAHGCGARKTVRDFDLRLSQRYLWGTSDWEADYGRRSFIESANAGITTHFAKLSRSSIRVMGRAKVTFAFGILCAVMNMRLIRERYGDLLELSGTVEPLPNTHRKPFRSRYKSIANPRAGRGRAPTAPLPTTMVAPAVARTHE